jgi:hypothetical protein
LLPEDRNRLIELVALDNNDDLWEAVRRCAALRKTEPEAGAWFTMQKVLEDIGDLTESGPVSAAPWERIREKLVPALRRVIQSPDSETAGDLARTWARLKQEEPVR